MKKILIIEDDQTICDELSDLLNCANYQSIVLKDFHNEYNNNFG